MTTLFEQDKKIMDLEKRVKKLELTIKKLTEVRKPKPGVIDELFGEAVKLIETYEKVSSSLLQRRLSIGYARSARIIDQLIETGLISRISSSLIHKVNSQQINIWRKKKGSAV